MKRTTLSLPDDLAQALAREARRRSTSASAVAREALAEHLQLVPGQARKLPFAALGGSGQRTTGRDMERLLEREWAGGGPGGSRSAGGPRGAGHARDR